MSEFKLQLLAVEAKLTKEPHNEELIKLKEDLIELIELSEETEEPVDEPVNKVEHAAQSETPKDSADNEAKPKNKSTSQHSKRDRNKKKKLNIKEKLRDTNQAMAWQAFASKGLKGVPKKSIFASPVSTLGKVGVGTNGIADAPSSSGRPNRTTERKPSRL